jgi:hypothetical protein
LTIALLLLAPAGAAAQGRMPHAGANAVGGDVGVFPPRQDGMTRGLDLHGFFEHYLTARDSVRVGVEFANPKVEIETTDSVRQVRLGADLVHNWERGAIHPFAGAGLGAYFLQGIDNGHDSGPSAKKLGGSLFGGAEFFTSKTFSVKAEGRYHVVSKWNGYDPSGLALTVGVKSYF